MGELRNRRHEAFARELAKGGTTSAAYVAAGFKANRGNASKLKASQSIQQRLAELKDQPARPPESNGRDPKGQFQQGVSGNPVGEEFLFDLRGEWQRSGVSALQRIAKDDPTAFVKVVANVLPREVDATLNVDFTAASSFIEAFRLARRHVADSDDPLLLDLTAEPQHEAD